jgi:carbonic anhydrase
LDPTFEVQGSIANLAYEYDSLLNITLINTRHTFEGTNLGYDNTLSFVGLHTYILTEFHFHVPSEHRIEGQQFPMELHLLHSDNDGRYATLVLLYSASDTADEDKFLAQLAAYLPDIPSNNRSVTINSVDILSQVDIGMGFYHYEGSTTTPPCVEGVQWFVVRNPIPVGVSILSKYTSVLNNARPLQGNNGRIVTVYIPGEQDSDIQTWVLAIALTGLGVLGILVVLGIIRVAYRAVLIKRQQNTQQELVGFMGSTNNEEL